MQKEVSDLTCVLGEDRERRIGAQGTQEAVETVGEDAAGNPAVIEETLDRLLGSFTGCSDVACSDS